MDKWSNPQFQVYLEEERRNCYWFWFKGKIAKIKNIDGEIYEQNLSGKCEWNGIRLQNGFNHCFGILEDKLKKYMDLKEQPQSFEEFQKNIKRVSDIVEKSDGDVDKMISLARTQANRITNEGKAINRAIAAKKMKQEEIFEVFFQRAYELGSVSKQEYREYKLEKLGI